jgi:hypothetical protein
MQELSSAKEEYTPEFDLTGVKSSAESWVVGPAVGIALNININKYILSFLVDCKTNFKW